MSDDLGRQMEKENTPDQSMLIDGNVEAKSNLQSMKWYAHENHSEA